MPISKRRDPPAEEETAAAEEASRAAAPPVGRLAPSPTGAQHLGNARTYLLAWLAARQAGGKLILRIEDIDSPRVKEGARGQAIEDLAWLGLDWDEGPDRGGAQGPYIQTERSDLYAAALQRLIEAGRAYPCVCTRKDIAEAASAPHVTHEAPVYPGTCAGWQGGDALPAAGTFCWRFRTRARLRRFVDLVSGEHVLAVGPSLGDFPLTHKRGTCSYQLAVVCDDLAMGVTQVVRGDDLISSTFRQLELIDALAGQRPQYAHVPLVCGKDGRRLAKRHGDTRLAFFRDAGVPPERIIGWAAWSSGLCSRWQEVSAAELLGRLDFATLRRHPARVDETIEQRLLE